MTPKGFRWAVVGLLLAAALAHSPALSAPYYFDDFTLFSDAAMMPGGSARVFDLARTRTLTYVSFLASFRGGGQSPHIDHALNLGLFLALLVASALSWSRLLGARVAVIATLIVALHPLAVEPVAYVFARATLLAALFSVTSLLAWTKNRPWLSVTLAVAAMASKEEAVVLPAFFILFELLFKRRSLADLRPLLPQFAVMTVASLGFAGRVLWAAAVTPDSGALIGLKDLSALDYFLAQGRVIWIYTRLAVVPLGLNFDHQIDIPQSMDALGLLGWLGIAAACAYCVRLSRRDPIFFFPVAALVFLLPTSSIAPLGDLAAERRLLMPIICLAAFAAVLLERRLSDRRLAAAAVLLALVLSGLTYRRALMWSDAESLWQDTVEKSPKKARPKLHLARALEARGAIALPEREQLLRAAVDVEPESAGAWGELGVFLLRAREFQPSVEALITAYELAPTDPSLAANLGVAVAAQDDMDRAEELFQEALAIDPCHFDARNNLLFLLRSREDREAAQVVAQLPDGCLLPPGQEEALRRASDI